MKKLTTLFSILILWQNVALSQCTNNFKFPIDNLQKLPYSGEQIITSNQFAGDYFIIEDLIIGRSYEVSSSNATDYFTVRDSDGIVLFEHGETPLIFAPLESSISIHINLSSPNCGLENTERSTSISCTDCEDEPSKVGIDNTEPDAILDINGEIRIGSSNNVPKAGMIRWNAENNDFEGFDGTEWISFTKSSNNTWGQATSSEGTENASAIITNGSSNLGYSISIDGNYAVIGSPYENINGNINQGAGYVFHYNGSQWIEQDKIVANDGGANDFYGKEVSISGNFIIVGVQDETINGNTKQGAAYIYHREAGSWIQQSKLIADVGGDSFDNFGSSVSIKGNIVFIGAPFYDSPTYFDNGVVFVFQRSGNTWIQSQIIQATDINTDHKFGFDVDLSDNYAIIGTAPGEFSPFYNNPSAYIFQKIGTVWVQQSQLYEPDPQFEDLFSRIVSIDGDHAVVSAIGNNVNGNLSQGVAYVFQRQGSSWNPMSKLFLENGSANDNFGSAIDISNDELIIGTPNFNSGNLTSNGLAVVYRKQGDTWIEVSKINASDAEDMDNFGFGVGIHLDHLIIGAPYKDISTNTDQGKIYFVKKN